MGKNQPLQNLMDNFLSPGVCKNPASCSRPKVASTWQVRKLSGFLLYFSAFPPDSIPSLPSMESCWKYHLFPSILFPWKFPLKIQLFPEVAVATARHVQLEIPLKGRLSISHSINGLKEVSKSKKSTGTTNKNNQQRSCHPWNWFQNFRQRGV